jgi:hypothetical protein
LAGEYSGLNKLSGLAKSALKQIEQMKGCLDENN